MDGANKEFMGGKIYNGTVNTDKPLRFLEINVVSTVSLTDEARLPLRTWEGDFDLIPESKSKSGPKLSKILWPNDADTGGQYYYLVRLQDRALYVRRNVSSSTGFVTHGIGAYYLSWNSCMVFSREIGTDYNLFFTAQLSGCTFIAVGDNRQNMTVAHFNHKKMTAETRKVYNRVRMNDQEPILETEDDVNRIIRSRGWHMKPHGFAFRPGQYKGEDVLATIIGCRINKNWTFYYQKVDLTKSGKYKIKSVDEVPKLDMS